MIVDRTAPYIAIVEDGEYWVADSREWKLNLGSQRGTPNSYRTQHGGARVSQFYRLPETALQHRNELNGVT